MICIRKILILSLLLLICSTNVQAQKDTLTREQYIKQFTGKSDSLNQRALKLATPSASKEDLNEAISLIMKGLHNYARFRDSTGLRETFDHLAFVYHLQKKQVQAKWFYIQSNTFARQLKDTANIIHSLINLADVKADIKDIDLAHQDLAEAMTLAKTQKGITAQAEVLQAYAKLYEREGKTARSLAALGRIKFMNDSITKLTKPIALADSGKVNPVDNVKKQVIVQPRSNTAPVLVIVGILVLVLLGVIIIRRKRR